MSSTRDKPAPCSSLCKTEQSHMENTSTYTVYLHQLDAKHYTNRFANKTSVNSEKCVSWGKLIICFSKTQRCSINVQQRKAEDPQIGDAGKQCCLEKWLKWWIDYSHQINEYLFGIIKTSLWRSFSLTSFAKKLAWSSGGKINYKLSEACTLCETTNQTPWWHINMHH